MFGLGKTILNLWIADRMLDLVFASIACEDATKVTRKPLGRLAISSGAIPRNRMFRGQRGEPFEKICRIMRPVDCIAIRAFGKMILECHFVRSVVKPEDQLY